MLARIRPQEALLGFLDLLTAGLVMQFAAWLKKPGHTAEKTIIVNRLWAYYVIDKWPQFSLNQARLLFNHPCNCISAEVFAALVLLQVL